MTRLEALKKIAERDGGVLTPSAVINEARDENSPLHNSFTWDDTEAAKKWRVHEAQWLIRSFKIEVESHGKKLESPVFIGVSTDRENESPDNPYRLARDVANDEDLMTTAENDALDQLKALKRRYEYLKRLKDVWDAIDAVPV